MLSYNGLGLLGETSHLSMPRKETINNGGGGGYIARSLHYLAPEDLAPPTKDLVGRMIQTPACDCWAAGCVLYALLTFTLPFNDTFLPRLQMVPSMTRRGGGEDHACWTPPSEIVGEGCEKEMEYEKVFDVALVALSLVCGADLVDYVDYGNFLLDALF
jgi:hypothetical protein